MIELVPVTEADRWTLFEWRNDPEVARYMYQRDPIERGVHDDWFTRLLAGGDRKGWVISMDGLGVGAAFMSGVDLTNRRATWAFYLADSSTRGRGVGGAVEVLVLEEAFTGLGLHKLCCEVLSFNQAVVSMHQKFGFVQEGLLREHWWRDDDWQDVHVLAMFEDEWASRREEMLTKMRSRGLIA
jgi:UDP-4-amino-4,6-dideoxy-N-acetyl-beta-L-altrosamine N-acetyltransferase